MANSRIKDLPEEVSSAQLQALLNTLYLAVDESSFSIEKKLVLSVFLTNAIVTSNANDYQAMTPKAFYDSYMTSNRYGVGKLNHDYQTEYGSGSEILNCIAQTAMQSYFKRIWYLRNGAHAYPNVNAEDSNMKALRFHVTFDTYIGANGKYTYTSSNLILPTGRVYKKVFMRLVIGNTSVQDGGIIILEYLGTETKQQLRTTGIYFGIFAGGRDLFMQASITSSYRCSATINAILD